MTGIGFTEEEQLRQQQWQEEQRRQAAQEQYQLQELVAWIIPFTLPKTNIAPTNGWLEYYFPIGEAYFQGLR